jgi:hypothetical protein
MITYDAIPGGEGCWRATIATSVGRVSATGHTLDETRNALERNLRDLRREESPHTGVPRSDSASTR